MLMYQLLLDSKSYLRLHYVIFQNSVTNNCFDMSDSYLQNH
jgi:hypothetical protein